MVPASLGSIPSPNTIFMEEEMKEVLSHPYFYASMTVWCAWWFADGIKRGNKFTILVQGLCGAYFFGQLLTKL